MYLLVVLVFLVFILWKLKHSNLSESFQGAWNNYIIYTSLSTRLKVGIYKPWLNLNGLALGEQLFEYCNVHIVLYNSVYKMIDDLLVTKHIDIVFVTEADYMLYLSKKMNESRVDKNFISKHKDYIKHNFVSRRLFTLNPIYRIFLANNNSISKPDDISGKMIQLTNITNKLYQLDKDLLKRVNYKKFYESEEESNTLYGNINNIGLRMDGYFMDIDNPNKNMKMYSYYKNITMIDLYDSKKSFENSNQILNEHIYLTKDKMNLQNYPEIIERRKQAIEFYNLPYQPNEVNCYSYKVIGITREEIDDEWIYSFTKSISDNLSNILKNMGLPDIKKEDLYRSKIHELLPPHNAVYNPEGYIFGV